MKPLALPPNQLHRFYRGGAAIAALRGIALTDDHAPEDWVGATNTSFGSDDEGLARLEDGRLVRDAIQEAPADFLGPEHVERFGPDPALLVKLLDAGERLPVHLHPGRAFAEAHLGSAFGKTEAWAILAAEPDAQVHLGFREPVDPPAIRDWVRAQETEAMLAAMLPVAVAAGDVLLVPAGTPHAIGAGIFMVELQEPTDLSVLLEWERLPGVDEEAATLGLGWERALEAVDREPWGEARLAEVRNAAAAPAPERAEVAPLLPASADPYFRGERVRPQGAEVTLEPGFAVLVVLAGEGALATESGDERSLRRGDTLLLPHAAGATWVSGEVELLRCRPPDPAAGTGAW